MKRLSIRQHIIVVLVIDIIICITFILTYSFKQKSSADLQISESSIQRICELATLDCYYHNVSEWRKGGKVLSGAKKLWMEYDGIVRVGIKANQLKISIPDKDGIITVSMPDASILDKDLDEQSLHEIDSTSPLWGFIPLYDSVSIEERKKALADAQEDMVASASQNGMILDEAQERAKKIIEQNIISMGRASGKEYKVKFIDVGEAQPTPLSEEAGK